VTLGAPDVIEVVVLATGAGALLQLTARLYGGTSSPTKYGLNGTMPAT
jgi:hypothetical protein